MASNAPQNQRFRELGNVNEEEQTAKGTFGRKEELSKEEQEGLGSLSSPLQELRQEEPLLPSEGEWREVMVAVKREVARTDLTWDEKKLRLRDMWRARRGQGRTLLIGSTIAIGILAAAVIAIF